MVEIYYFGQIVLAVFIGAVLGFQRERWGKSAGPRTHALVCAGATLFTILSLSAFGVTGTPYVAAQIVTGVGFLVAGIIIKHEDRVAGLTTAAGLWMAAAIGMAVGARFYILSILTGLLILLLLFVDDRKYRKENCEEVK